jgi:hypothetical protein
VKAKRKAPTVVTVPKPVAKSPPSGVLGTVVTDSRGSNGYGLLLIETLLALAICCFGIAAIPVAHLRWRPIASFVAHRHVEMTLFGVVFLAVAGFGLLLRSGL